MAIGAMGQLTGLRHGHRKPPTINAAKPTPVTGPADGSVQAYIAGYDAAIFLGACLAIFIGKIPFKITCFLHQRIAKFVANDIGIYT